MNKDKKVEVEDSREEEVDLMEKVENMNGRMLIKARLSGKVVILTKEVLVLTEEEVILTLEVVSMVIVSDVVKKGIYILNVDLPKVDRIIEML